jgi:hypothetical protein
MRRFIALSAGLACMAANALALPGLEISAGGYLGSYKPSLKTLNEKVLLYDHQTGFGSSMQFGGQLRLGLPLGLGGGIDLGYWNQQKEWTDDQLDRNSIELKLIPLDFFVQYAMPIVPLVLKGKVGATAGTVQASLDISETRVSQWDHYWNSEGSTSTFGLFGGLDLVALPKVNISAEVGYKMGEVDRLTIKASHEPDNVNDILEYYDHDKDQILPLPLELNGVTTKIVVTYVF